MSVMKPLFGTPLNRAHPLSQGLVGCWLFNEGSGLIARDSSGNNNHGTLTNMADPGTPTSGWTSGPNGGALAFDGTDDYVTAGKPIVAKVATSAFSCGAIFRMTGGGGALFDEWSGGASFAVYPGRSTSGRISTYLETNGTTPNWKDNLSSPVNDGVWHQCFLVYDGAHEILYLDGISIYSTPDTGLITAHSTFFKVGANANSLEVPGVFFPGLISSVVIYNSRALSAQEISYLYAFPYCMFDPDGAFDPATENTLIIAGNLPRRRF